MRFYLYLKTHKITGLKYLGYTSSADPIKYPGSGKYWKQHLRVHGKEVDTEILIECSSKEEIKKFGEYYSQLWNIVKSPEWANLKIESGDGGSNGSMSECQKMKISNKLKGRIFSEEHKQKLSKAGKGRKDPRSPEGILIFSKKVSKKFKGRVFSKEHKQNMSKSHIGKKHSLETKIAMKNAWTDERKAAQSERTRMQHLKRKESNDELF